MTDDFKCYDREDPEFDYAKLDPGIREVVRWLHSLGYVTTDSGDGKHKLERGWDEAEIIPHPHVYIEADPLEDPRILCQDLVRDVRTLGIEVVAQTEAWMEVIEKGGNVAENDLAPKPYIELTYDPIEDIATIGLFYVTSDMIAKPSGA